MVTVVTVITVNVRAEAARRVLSEEATKRECDQQDLLHESILERHKLAGVSVD